MYINTTTVYHSTTTPVSNISNSTITIVESFWKRLNLSMIILLTFALALATLGNSLVLVATWTERSLHQPNKYFIACLAVADLLVGMFVAPSRLYLYIVQYKMNYPELNIHLCRFLVWMDTVSLTASIYTMTFISFDRYLKISKPLQYKSRMTTFRSLKIIFIIWLVSFCFATYAAIPASGSIGIVFRSSCGGLESKTRVIRFYTFLSVSAFFLPTIIILIMYTLIFFAVRKRRKMLRDGELGQTTNVENQRIAFLKDLKVIRMLLIVVGVFICCWGPLFIYLLLLLHDSKLFMNISFEFWITTQNLIMLLPLLNSVFNPIIYACLDETFKQAFKHLFQRMMCRPNSSRLQSSGAVELRLIRTTQHKDC